MLNDKIKDLVKDYFSLGEQGFNDFCRIINSNYIDCPKEFEFIINSNNQRKIIEIPEDMKPFIDDGYPIIKQLKSFCSKYNISYNEYNLNRVVVSGQERKLFKLMGEYYFKELSYHMEKLGCNINCNVNYGLIREVCVERGDNFRDVILTYEKYYKPSERKAFQQYLSQKNIDTAEGIASELITRISEKIGAFKIKTDKKLYFVISKNMDDFFLSSYEEGWTSCLNPESSSSLWSCLPFLMADNGRCVVYISDLKEKEYNGIRSYRMFKRGWGIVGTDGDSEKIYTGTFYPSKTRMDNDFFKNLGIDSIINSMPNQFISKYPIELFYNVFNVFDYLYQDDTRFVHGYDGMIRLINGDRNHTMIVNHKMSGIAQYNFHMMREGHTLTELINTKTSVENFTSEHFCSECKAIVNHHKTTYYINGEKKTTCTSCMNTYIEKGLLACSRCKNQFDLRSDIRFNEDNLICPRCHIEMMRIRDEEMKSKKGISYESILNSMFSSPPSSRLFQDTPIGDIAFRIQESPVAVEAYAFADDGSRNNRNENNDNEDEDNDNPYEDDDDDEVGF